ncbi:MAG: carbon monoxide dehydrogenase [Candidatus Omnitrophica bacterium]|nr:carbon monoxide dehydrogenase [Candidatus Omnitrophota bacterium]
MGYTLAICGKGGTGKTTIASLIVGWLAKNQKGKILAVDADPNSNLASALGVEAKVDIGEIVDEMAKDPSKIPQGMSKQDYIDYRIHTDLAEAQGFDILVMGRPEGPGCYCYVNNVLRDVVKKISNSYDFIIIDNEAGLEHLSRKTTRSADCLIIVSDNSSVGLRSAKRIYDLVKELGIKVGKEYLVLNRSSNNFKAKDQIKELEYLDTIPEDKELLNLSAEGKSVLELKNGSAAIKSIERICRKIWQ